MKAKQERKPPTSIALPAELQVYLQKKAAEGYRSMTQEVIMRLEQTRQADVTQLQGAKA
jgi:hypothetical protein